MKTVFLRVIEAEDKAAALLAAVRDPERARDRQRFEIDTNRLSQIKTSPFAYWASDRVCNIFTRLPSLASSGRLARTTNPTTDDFRWARAWWEPTRRAVSTRWRSWHKGGGFSPYYRDVELVVDWDERRCTYNGYLGTIYRPDVRPANLDFFFRPGLTWVYRGHSLCVQAMPSGTAISTRGNGLYADEAIGAFDLGLLNSTIADALIKLSLGRGGHPQFDIGDVNGLPVPVADLLVSHAARRAWSLHRSLDTRTETSHAFVVPALLQVAGADLAARAAVWAEHVRTVEAELAGIQAEIDERCFALYGTDEADRRTITEGFGTSGSEEASSDRANDAEEDDAGDDSDENESTADAATLAVELVSWAVGVAFGRFDMRLATGARPMPTEPEPFDPLPACSPGMLTGDDGLPLTRPPTGYPLAVPEAGVLVDDLGHVLDLPTAVRAVFDAVFGAGADRWWNDVAALLDPKGHDLRVWFAGRFFEHHIKRYSKSRRKAPILWQLATASGRYSVWLYAHHLTRDSFFQIHNEVVGPKLTHEERLLTILMQNAGGSPSAAERKDIAAQESFVEELRAFRDEVARIAPLWNPDLNDGVIINFAPLWRLVPHHRTWQKECRECWDKLVAGDYDWAHLAMHLWPERVVPKCADDRSLAIAHGLEEVFWVRQGSEVREFGSSESEPRTRELHTAEPRTVEPQAAERRTSNSDRWQKRNVDQATISRLIVERMSPAVKDALKNLLAAPAPSTARGGGKRAAAPRRAPATQRSPRTGGTS